MVFEKVKEVIANIMNLDPDEITLESNIIEDFGADSLDAYQVIMELEEAFDIEIPTEEIEKIRTVEEVVDLITNELN